MSIPKRHRHYLNYDTEIGPGIKDTLQANWGPCPSCGCNVYPVEMASFRFLGELFFEGTCPQCGKMSIAAYDRVID